MKPGNARVMHWKRVLVREPDAGNLPVRFDEGDVETVRPRHVFALLREIAIIED